MNSIKDARKKKLNISQRQAVIKLMGKKKDRGKRYIKNLRPISLLNVDYKIMLKALATRLKKILLDLISCQQTKYIKSRFIEEESKLI